MRTIKKFETFKPRKISEREIKEKKAKEEIYSRFTFKDGIPELLLDLAANFSLNAGDVDHYDDDEWSLNYDTDVKIYFCLTLTEVGFKIVDRDGDVHYMGIDDGKALGAIEDVLDNASENDDSEEDDEDYGITDDVNESVDHTWTITNDMTEEEIVSVMEQIFQEKGLEIIKSKCYRSTIDEEAAIHHIEYEAHVTDKYPDDIPVKYIYGFSCTPGLDGVNPMEKNWTLYQCGRDGQANNATDTILYSEKLSYILKSLVEYKKHLKNEELKQSSYSFKRWSETHRVFKTFETFTPRNTDRKDPRDETILKLQQQFLDNPYQTYVIPEDGIGAENDTCGFMTLLSGEELKPIEATLTNGHYHVECMLAKSLCRRPDTCSETWYILLEDFLTCLPKSNENFTPRKVKDRMETEVGKQIEQDNKDAETLDEETGYPIKALQLCKLIDGEIEEEMFGHNWHITSEMYPNIIANYAIDKDENFIGFNIGDEQGNYVDIYTGLNVEEAHKAIIEYYK